MEMYKIGVAFEILEDGKSAPVGYTKVSGHLILVSKDGLYKKGKMGAGSPQKHLIQCDTIPTGNG